MKNMNNSLTPSIPAISTVGATVANAAQPAATGGKATPVSSGMKRFLFDTWYGALALWGGTSGVFLAFLAFDVFLPGCLPRALGASLGKTLFLLALLSGVLFFIAWVVSLARRHWKRALLQAFLGLGLLAWVLCALLAVLIAADLGLGIRYG